MREGRTLCNGVMPAFDFILTSTPRATISWCTISDLFCLAHASCRAVSPNWSPTLTSRRLSLQSLVTIGAWFPATARCSAVRPLSSERLISSAGVPSNVSSTSTVSKCPPSHALCSAVDPLSMELMSIASLRWRKQNGCYLVNAHRENWTDQTYSHRKTATLWWKPFEASRWNWLTLDDVPPMVYTFYRFRLCCYLAPLRIFFCLSLRIVRYPSLQRSRGHTNRPSSCNYYC